MGASVDELSDVLVRAVLPIAVAAVLSAAAVGVIAVISPAAAVIARLLPPDRRRGRALAVGAGRGDHRRPGRCSTTRPGTRRRCSRSNTPPNSESAAGSTRSSPKRLDDNGDWGRAADRAARPAAIASAAPTVAIGVSVLGARAGGHVDRDPVAPTTLAILMLLPLSAFEATTALPAAAIALTRARIAATAAATTDRTDIHLPGAARHYPRSRCVPATGWPWSGPAAAVRPRC